MNAPHIPVRSRGARRAWAQPRFLLGAAALTLAGATWASFAAPAPATKPAVAMPHTSSKSSKKPVSLSDLPGLVARYGESRAASANASGGRTTRNIGTGQTGFNLVETDLTPNSPSDEREPVVSPGGDFIAFTSTGADSNNDGAIDSLGNGFRHIWIMNRNGSGQRQITGLGTDAGRNQTHPTWSPDGNQIAYSDEEPAFVNDAPNPNAGGSQLFVVSALDQTPVPTQRTFFGQDPNISKSAPAVVQSPAWAPSGLSIAFVTNYDGRQDGRDDTATNPRSLPTRDIFSIAPDGSVGSLTRITGDSTDPIGNASDDDHPAWATVNTNVLFYSSNRDTNGVLGGVNAGGRRIWRIFSDGSAPAPVTDPAQRSNGQGNDVDDYPAASLQSGASAERVAFQTNSFLDDSDQADGARGRDLNVWTVPVSTNSFNPVEPRTYVGSYDNGQILGVNTRTLQISSIVPRIPSNLAQTIPNVEGVVVSPDGRYVFAADRNNKRVLRFNEVDGSPAGSANSAGTGTPANQAQFTPSTVNNPVGLAISGGFLYVTSGFQGTTPAPTAPTPAIYRFDLDTGDPAPSAANSTDTMGLFSSGDTTGSGVITNGAEGISITRNGRYIAVADLVGNKINLYNRNTGVYQANATDNNTPFVVADQTLNGGLNLPTGITWGPDLNGDGNEDLYVCSSGNDSIKAYSGPSAAGTDPFAPVGAAGSANSTRPGTFIGNLVADPGNGTGPGSTGLNGPEFIRIADLATSGTGAFGGDGTPEIYVSSFRTLGVAGNGVPGGGFQVNRYGLDMVNKQALAWPAGAPSPSTTPTNAAWISLPPDPNNPASTSSLAGAASFDFNLTTRNQAAGIGTTIRADETAGSALVLTNILSSPTNFAASRLTAPQDVDRSADREPSFSRTTATAQTISRLVFASNRLYTPGTGSNGSTTPTNPFGGEGESGTHDIWSTSTQDTTPPALVPQGAGNLQYPVVAPQPNAPFFAPRTAEAGLRPNLTPTAAEIAETADPSRSSANTYARRGGLRFAVVLRDAESGLQETTGTTPPNGVRVSFFNADLQGSQQYTHKVNEDIVVPTSRETKAAPFAIGGATSFSLNVYDDGPIANGGHEQQAGAVAGDGNFYCEGLLPTPGSAGDFYIDVATRDRSGNSLNYDNAWGISTRRFVRQTSGRSDLFVSDYTAGQLFPFTLGGDDRFANMLPVETFYLRNVSGVALDGTTPLGTSIPDTFTTGNVDIWRILCRGPVTQDVLNAYRPSIVKQIDPTTPNPAPNPTSTPAPGATAAPTPTPGPTATPTATPVPFSQLTRNVAVANSSVIWASPYAGTVFAGPGTIADPTTQANLTSFLNDGGRFFLSGRDVAFALSSSGSVSNTFLTNELAAKFSGEASANGVAASDGGLLGGKQIPGSTVTYSGDFVNLQFPLIGAATGNYEDSALTQDPQPGFASNQFDVLTPQSSAGTTLKTDYTGGGGVVGQRIQKDNRNNGLQSRAVFFSFGLEAVNRRYTKATGFPKILNTRNALATYILQYFKTSGVSGTVINNATNLPVPNFLVRVDGAGGTFFARTDANGNYSITGLPGGGYTVTPYLDANGLTSPQGFFGGTPTSFGVVGGGAPATGQNLRVIPAVPGAIIGRAVTSNGSFADRSNDTPLPNLAVLVRSVGESSIFPNGGKFARLTTTNATGDFSLPNVPAQAEMEVIFNPASSDIPSNSNISYGGPNPNFGRRILPDTIRPERKIIVPSGDNFILNDTGKVIINGATFTVDTNNRPDTPADERVPIIVPSGPTISGVVSVNGAAFGGATVQLFKTDSSGAATSEQAPNPVQTSGAGGKTGTNGVFSFVDVSATPSTSGGTKYVIRTTITRDSVTLTRDVPITLFQGVDQTKNVDFILATLSGRVVRDNNVSVFNVNVMLQNPDGTAFSPSRMTKTNASGNYSFANVPVGGYTRVGTTNVFSQTNTATTATVSYNVFASLGSLTGNSGNFSVRATDTAVTVPTIQLINQQLSGLVQLQVDANNPTNLSGATVELLDESGNSLSPARTTTTGTDGTYSFGNVTAGTYRVRATFRGDVTVSAPFTATAGAFMVSETLRIQLHTIYGTTFDTRTSDGRAVGATVTLSQNGTLLQTVTSVAAGSFQFAPVAAGSNYVLRATKDTLVGTANAPAIPRDTAPAVQVNIFLKVDTTGVANATSFDKGRTYSFSTPYATSANAMTRNVYTFLDNRNNATIPLSAVFNYAPVGRNAAGNTVRFYSVSRFNPNTLAFVALDDNALLSRGEGYLLRVTNETPASGDKLRFTTPGENPNLKVLTGTEAIERKFLVNLVYNDSLSSNGLNGRNFIGFGFDPAKYGSVVWDNTSTGATAANTTPVQVLFGTRAFTIKDAAAAGLIFPTLTTTDSATGRSVTATTLNSFGGYFVQARKAGVSLRFQFPQANSTN